MLKLGERQSDDGCSQTILWVHLDANSTNSMLIPTSMFALYPIPMVMLFIIIHQIEWRDADQYQ